MGTILSHQSLQLAVKVKLLFEVKNEIRSKESLFNLPIIKLANFSVFEFSDFQIVKILKNFWSWNLRAVWFSRHQIFRISELIHRQIFKVSIFRSSEFFRLSDSRASELLTWELLRTSKSFDYQIFTRSPLANSVQVTFVRSFNFRILFESSDFNLEFVRRISNS